MPEQPKITRSLQNFARPLQYKYNPDNDQNKPFARPSQIAKDKVDEYQQDTTFKYLQRFNDKMT